jgi:RimJ/RimL family protein N-acetyltransferase
MDAADPVRARLAAVWPPFGIRIQSERLVLRLPTDDDIVAMIEVAKAGIHPPDEMPFGVSWTDASSPAFERSFVQHHWDARGGWSPSAWGLHLMVELDGAPIGSQSILADDFATRRTVDTGSWLGRAWQGRGLGREMRGAVLAFAFDGLGAQRAETEAYLDNGPSNGVSRSLGYADDGFGTLAPRGVDRTTQRWLMTVDAWRSRPRPPVTIEGLDPCRELFGA